ncbi:uncharacterized protein LOC143366390 isoform X2 [Andrena cerasifolii]|uniref:uncharacterized protein LOC143366390 isoform X2 n=1 Tax=Andrena cerasifolii TaxID=2819439 RepID=UPI004037CBBD
MSPNHVRREYKTRSSINTRAEKKRPCSTMENDEHLNQKRRKKSISLINTTGHTEEASFNKDDSLYNVKRVKKLDEARPIEHKSYTLRNRNIDSSFEYISLNKTVEKIQLPEKTINSDTAKLMDTPVAGGHNHTQHRSTKSSEKLSKNLLSSKTRSVSPPKLLRTPVKWNPLIDSSTESQRKDLSFKKNRLQIKSRPSDFTIGTRSSLSKHNTPTRLKVASTSETKKKSKNASLSMKQGLRKFSKSPKIVLKFAKTKLVLKKLSPVKLMKTPGSKCFTNTSSETAVELEEREKFTPRKRSVVARNVVSSTASTATDVASSMLKEPVVVLQRLSHIIPFVSSPSRISTSLVDTRINSQLNASNKNASEKTFNSTPGRLPRLSKSNETRHLRAKQNDRSTPITPVKLQVIGKTAVSSLKKSVPTITITSPLMSSTPRHQRQQSESNKKRETIETRRTDDTALDASKLKLVYSPSTHQETTLNAENEEEEVKDKDGTYELAEPKTPSLRKKMQKQQSSIIEPDSNKNKLVKESLKVRFTSLSPDTITNCPYVNDSSNIMIRATPKKGMLKSPADGFRTRPNFVSTGATSPTVVLRRSTDTSSQKRSKTKSVTTPSISSPLLPFVPSVKQPDPKSSATKKIPNFMKIHRRMFAKSESIVDAKKRLEERHTTLTALKANKSIATKISSKERNRLPNQPTSNGPYTRYGFKIRKNDAINCIMRTSNLRSIRDKQQQETRAIIKGVRTNRRFELQMQARNKKY